MRYIKNEQANDQTTGKIEDGDGKRTYLFFNSERKGRSKKLERGQKAKKRLPPAAPRVAIVKMKEKHEQDGAEQAGDGRRTKGNDEGPTTRTEGR